jgi:hypothetical protein
MPDGILYVRQPRFFKNCRATEEEDFLSINSHLCLTANPVMHYCLQQNMFGKLFKVAQT